MTKEGGLAVLLTASPPFRAILVARELFFCSVRRPIASAASLS